MTKAVFTYGLSVMRIRISCNTDPDPKENLNLDLDPESDPGVILNADPQTWILDVKTTCFVRT